MGLAPYRLSRATCAATTMTLGKAVFRQPAKIFSQNGAGSIAAAKRQSEQSPEATTRLGSSVQRSGGRRSYPRTVDTAIVRSSSPRRPAAPRSYTADCVCYRETG